MLKRVFLALSLPLVINPFTLAAQVATGAYPLGTYDSLGADTINVGNLNVMLDVPVLHKAGRAGTNFTYDLFYNGAIWTPTSGAWAPDSNWGWSIDTQPLTGYITERYQAPGSCIPHARSSIEIIVANVAYHDRFGVVHGWMGERTENMCTGATTDTLSNTWSTDHLYYYGASGITDARGVVIHAPVNTSSGAANYTDTNGNAISTDGHGNFTDTTGTVVLNVSGAAPSNKVFAYKDPNGTSRTITVVYTNYNIDTNFGCSALTDYANPSVPLISTIDLPDGSSYNFTYEHASGTPAGSVTGRLASVQTPTGGLISYSYPGANGGINCMDGSAIGLVRTQSSTPGTPTRTYTRSSAGTALSHTSLIDEQSNDTEYDFVQGSNGSQATPTNLYESARTVYQGTGGTPLVARQVCYNQASQPCNQQPITPPIAQIDTYQTFDGAVQSGATTTYDSFLNVTSTKTYDFGTATSRGTLLQTEATPYSNGYLQSDTTTDSASNTIAKTLYTYGPGTVATSGVPSFSATSAGVNLLSIDRYTLGGANGYYNQQLSYYNTGSLYSLTSPLGTNGSATTTLSYESTNTFPTGATTPSPTGHTLSASATTDLASGIPLTSTGVNGAVSTNSNFDPFGRLQSSVTTYGTQTLADLTSTYQPTHVQILSYQSGGVSTQSDTFYDAYGRTIRTATQASASPTLFYILDTCYDTLGRVNFKSYPYTASSVIGSEVCSGAGDSYQYDALGRVLKVQHADTNNTYVSYRYLGSATQVTDENNIAHIYQADSLGRTSLVCEISSNSAMPNSGTPGSCGTLIAGTGFVTSYAYLNNVTTVTQGAQTRTFIYDGLGRLISKTEVEASGTTPTAPTTTYSYGFNSTGQVVTRITPQANQTNPAVKTTTTYQYDMLGRLVTVNYNDGVTPAKTFTYDQPLSGSTFSTGYSLGMMTAAGNTASTTQFSYDPLGRLQGTSQCLPGMCGATLTSVTRGYGYDWQGNQISEQYSTPAGLVSLGYGVNLAGQVVSVTGGQDSAVSSSLYAATTASMSPFGPTGATYGNGIAAVMNYDVFGHPTGMGLTQSSNPLYAWTATWSGQRVVNSGDSVNGGSAAYNYDDMNRLSTATMGGLNLSWVYDRYGNRWSQSASGTWPGTVTQPSLSFSNTTNRIATPGYSYDAAGNLTQDPLHSYTYDADGNLTAIDGGSTATYQYDALNRRVQAVTPSGTQDFDFNSTGQRATVWDGSGNLVSAQYYAGGHPLAYYLASDGHVRFRHQDWIGTDRLRTTYTGSIEGTFISLPYGDGLQTAQGTDSDKAHYMGLDQDTTDIEHATYRELASAQGRWLRPDPYDGSYNSADPQSFNRYSYVQNSPLSYSDPLGLTDCPDGKSCGDPGCPYGVCDDGGGTGEDTGNGSNTSGYAPGTIVYDQNNNPYMVTNTGITPLGNGFESVSSCSPFDGCYQNSVFTSSPSNFNLGNIPNAANSAPNNGTPQKPQDRTAKCESEASAASAKMPSPVPNGNSFLVGAVNGFVSGMRTGNPRGAVVGFIQGLIVRPLVNWTGQNVMYSGTFNACMSAGAAGTGFNLSAPGMVW